RLTLSMSSIEAAAIRRISEFRFSAAGALEWPAPSDCRSGTESASLIGSSGLRRTGGAYASGPGFCGLNWFALGQSARTTVIVCPQKYPPVDDQVRGCTPAARNAVRVHAQVA